MATTIAVALIANEISKSPTQTIAVTPYGSGESPGSMPLPSSFCHVPPRSGACGAAPHGALAAGLPQGTLEAPSPTVLVGRRGSDHLPSLQTRSVGCSSRI